MIKTPWMKKKKLIEATKKAIIDNQRNAADNVHEFASYKTDISDFKVDFEAWAEKELVNTNLEIEEVKNQIEGLKNDIKTYYDLLFGLGIGICAGATICGFGLAIAATGVAFGFFLFAAIIGGLIAIGCGIAMGVYINKINGKNKELIDAQAHLASLNKKQENIKRAHGMIKEVDDVLNTFSNLISVLSSCWDSIDAELTKLSIELDIYGTIYNTVPQEYKYIVNIWSAFAVALDMYISDV